MYFNLVCFLCWIFFSYSFPFLLLSSPSLYCREQVFSRRMMSMWFIIKLTFFITMVLMGKWNTFDEKEEVEYGNGPYHGEEEEIEGDDDVESDNENKPKQSSTPLWKYVTRLEGGKRGRTTKFPCPHCNKTYIGSYTHVRKHLYGIMPSDEKKNTTWVKTCEKSVNKR